MQKRLSSFSSWAELLSGAPRGAHVLQLYDRDAFLVRAVTHFVAEGIAQGECAILTGTRAHLDGIRVGLALQGFDTSAALRDGALLVFDVDEAVESVWRGGALSEERLREATEATLRPLSASGRTVRWWAETADAL
ncbi:MAG: MEDS domain-containing protein, partial [Clostridia bacterium]